MVFRVRSVDVAGQLVEQNLDAASETEAIRMAQRPGWVVLGARERAGRSLGRPTVLDPVAFGRDLSALLRAGISLVESISIIADRQTKQSLGQRLAGVHDRISQGQRLSAALEADSDLLPLFLRRRFGLQRLPGICPRLWSGTLTTRRVWTHCAESSLRRSSTRESSASSGCWWFFS